MPYLSFRPPSLVISHDWQKRFTRVEANGMAAPLVVAAALAGVVYFATKHFQALPSAKSLVKRAQRVVETSAVAAQQLQTPRTPKARTRP